MLSSMLTRLPTWRPIPKIGCLSRVSSRYVQHHRFNFVSFMLTKNGSFNFLMGTINSRHFSDAKDEQLPESYVKYSVEVEKQTDLERIREMQKYFEQYTEEYVELEAESEASSKTVTKSDRLRQRLEPLLDFQQDPSAGPFNAKEVVEILRAERAEDIVCIKVPVIDAPDKYVIICTPHNMRHGESLVLAIRKCFKLKTDCQVQPPKKAKVGRWLCYIFEDISLHLMSREARLKYDLESLWGIDWQETLDDELDIPNSQFPVSSII